MKHKKMVTYGTFFIGAMVASNFLNFLFNAYFGRVLSFEDFALVTLINSFVYILGIFLNALSNTVNHRVSYLLTHHTSGKAHSFYKSTYSKIALIGLVGILLWVISIPIISSFFYKGFTILPFIIFSPIIMSYALHSVNRGFLTAELRVIYVGLLSLVEGLIKVICGILFVYFGFNSFVYISVPISILTAFLIGQIILSNQAKYTQKHEVLSFPKRFYTASLLTNLSSAAFLTLDVLLVSHFFNPTIAGQYDLLSLVGKMIFFFGSLLTPLITTFAARDIGRNINPNKNFYRLLFVNFLLAAGMYLTVGYFGNIIVPILFGSKTVAILPYLPSYTLAILFFTLTNTLIMYHLARHHYLFSVISIEMSIVLVIGISLFHQSINSITQFLLVLSYMQFILTVCVHLLQKNGEFVLRNIIDLFDVFLPQQKNNNKIEGKRILIFNWRDKKHSFAGGAEVYIHELSKRWVMKGNKVTLFCGNDGRCPRNEIVDGVEIIRRGGFYFVYVWAFVYYLLHFRKKYDVIIDCENGIPFFTPLYANEKKFLLIHHIHQEVFRRSLSKPLSTLATFLELRLMPYVYKHIEVITVSPSSRQEIIDKSLSLDTPHIVYNGVDTTKYQPGEKSKTPLILYLGRLQYYKSINIFIKTAVKVLKTIPNAQFVIAGSGEEYDNLIKFARRLNVLEKIKFIGKVDEQEKIKLYQKAWVFVNPSLMEGWGITTIEANACGTPVVASNVPGLRDSVRNPHTGYLVKHGDYELFAKRITEIIINKKLRQSMSTQAIEWAKKFNWNKSARESLKILFK